MFAGHRMHDPGWHGLHVFDVVEVAILDCVHHGIAQTHVHNLDNCLHFRRGGGGGGRASREDVLACGVTWQNAVHGASYCI